MTRYAQAFKRDWRDVWSGEDLRYVVVAVWLLDDEERRASLREEGRALRAGYLMNYAINAPKELTVEQRRFEIKLDSTPYISTEDGPSQALTDAREQLSHVGSE